MLTKEWNQTQRKITKNPKSVPDIGEQKHQSRGSLSRTTKQLSDQMLFDHMQNRCVLGQEIEESLTGLDLHRSPGWYTRIQDAWLHQSDRKLSWQHLLRYAISMFVRLLNTHYSYQPQDTCQGNAWHHYWYSKDLLLVCLYHFLSHF